MNLNGTPMPNWRGFVAKPLESVEDPANNDLVAETGFGIFVGARQSGKTVYSFGQGTALEKVSLSAFRRIEALRRAEGKGKMKQLRGTEDAMEIAIRLEDFFEHEGAQDLKIQPRFKGCGILDSCFGDLLSDKTLYEIKCVERNLRSIDIRQVLAYCALNYQSRQYDLDHICIVNPRRGISFRFSIETLSLQTSGKNSAELFHEIGDFLMNFDTIQRPS